jgi:multiple antibiotic resistance protein
MAFPLIAGPGALATLLLFVVETRGQPLALLALLGVIMVVLALTLALLLLTTRLMKIMGVTGANVVSRLLGVVLAALAVQYVLDGLQQAFLRA